ncbi:unnamed protein product [Cunninghamella blakesleeana]
MEKWQYVGFVKSNYPKYNNGTKQIKFSNDSLSKKDKSTITKKKPTLKRTRTEPKLKEKEIEIKKKQRVKKKSLDEVEEELDDIINVSSKTISDQLSLHPLLSHSFILKHAIYGYSNDSIYRQEKKLKKKKTPSSKRSRLKKSGSRKRNVSKKEVVPEEEDELDSDNYGSDNNDDSSNDNEDNDEDEDEDEGDDDDEEDDHLDIWSCEFEPSISTKPSSTLLALCSAHHILILDTHQGRYLKKYTHPESKECFYTLSWTLLKGKQLEIDNTNDDDDDDDHSNTTILAAAGKLGSIKLLEPLQNHCYCILHGHTEPVLKLNFVKKEPRWLLSSSQDMTIRLWDIGTPSQQTEFSCLGIFKVPGTTLASSISISYGLSLLVAGTAKADLYQYHIKKSDIEKWRKHTYRSIDNDDNIDNASDEEDNNKNKKNNKDKLPILIQPKLKFGHGNEWHEGYVDDVYILGQDGNHKNELYKHVVSRGSNDLEILIWDPNSSTKSDADIFLSLNWPDNEENTGLRFCVVEDDDQKLLVSGDYEGGIRIFDIGDGKISKTLRDGSKEKYEPSKILKDPTSKNVIRDIAISRDGKTLVAVDSANCVFIWGIENE